MRFHFIRHGKRDHKIGDPSLTSEGREEAERLARKLASNGIARIFSSPLRGFAACENVKCKHSLPKNRDAPGPP